MNSLPIGELLRKGCEVLEGGSGVSRVVFEGCKKGEAPCLHKQNRVPRGEGDALQDGLEPTTP